MKDVLVLLYPGCIFFELALATELLAKKYNIIYATPDGSDHFASNGMILKAHTPYSKADLSKASAVIVPGGNFDSVKDNHDSDDLLKKAKEMKLWVAAICGGPFLLGKAGILSGKTISHGFNQDQLKFLAPYFEGVSFNDDKVTFDDRDHLATARPEAHIEFAVELAARLLAVDPARVGLIKKYYRGAIPQIRTIALGMFKNEKGQFLFHQGYDKKKDEYFYRPLGGGVDFGEKSAVTLFREIQEELGLEIRVSDFLGVYENIFTFEEYSGHEMVMVHKGEFLDKSIYDKTELDVYESGHIIAKAVWRSIEEIKAEGHHIYPLGLEDLIKRL